MLFFPSSFSPFLTSLLCVFQYFILVFFSGSSVLIFIATTLWKLSCILTEQSLFEKRVWQFFAVLKLTPLVTILIEVCHTFLMYPLGLYWNYVQRGSITCMLRGSEAIFFRGSLPWDWSSRFPYPRLWSYRSIPCIPSSLMTAHTKSHQLLWCYFQTSHFGKCKTTVIFMGPLEKSYVDKDQRIWWTWFLIIAVEEHGTCLKYDVWHTERLDSCDQLWLVGLYDRAVVRIIMWLIRRS